MGGVTVKLCEQKRGGYIFSKLKKGLGDYYK